MLAAVFAALLHLGTTPGDLHLHGDLRAAQQARSTDMVEEEDYARAELQVAPRLELASDGRLRLRLAWEPNLLLAEDLVGNTPSLSGSISERAVVLHRVQAGAALATLPGWTLQLDATASVGETLLVGEPTTGMQTGQAVATTARIPYLGYELATRSTGELAQRTTLDLSASYTRSGGDGEVARERVPLFEGVGLTGRVVRRMTRRQSLGLLLAANRSRVGESVRGDGGFVRSGAVWEYQLAAPSQLQLGLGATLPWQRVRAEEAPRLLPWAEATWVWMPRGLRPNFRISSAAEPVIDRYTGDVEVMASLSAAVGWEPFRDWRFGMRAHSAATWGWTGASAETDGPHTRTHGIALTAGTDLTDELRLGASVGSTWQRTNREGLPDFREDLVTLDLVARLFAW